MATYDGTLDNDVILGGMEDDVLLGGPGNDELSGMEGDDRLEGGPGNDTLEGGAGADEIRGGEDGGLGEFFGSLRNLIWGDTAAYVHSGAGVTIDLASGIAEGGHAEGDTLTGIESIRGSDHADVLVARNDDPSTPSTREGSTLYGQKGDDSLTGGDGADFLWGGKGNDTLIGGAASDYLEGGADADVLDGGASNDWATYELSDAGVTVNLATGDAEGGHAEGDTLTGIELLVGSRHADHLTGDDGFNVLEGGAGADTLDGGAGWDRVAYSMSDAGVTINLATGHVGGGYAEGDTLTGFESAWGSRYADLLIGGDNANLIGWYGNDTLEGGTGNDYLDGGAGADMIDGGAGWDTAGYFQAEAGVAVSLATGTGHSGDAEGDTLAGIEAINGSNHADHLTGDDSDNGLHGRAGADMIDGGEGSDHVGYWSSDAGVTVNLTTGAAQGGHAEGDTLTSIEQLHGSNYADHLTGDDGDNHLYGRDGDDTLDGGAGDDHLQGDAGNDMLDGGEGHDYLVGGEGADVLDGGAGYDTADYGASDAGVTVNLTSNRQEGGHAAFDRLTGIENLSGSSHADRLIGNGRNNDLDGREGNDTLISGAGDDHLHGGASADRLDGGDGHHDWAQYWGSDAGVTVNLATGTGQGGDAEGDTLTGIESIGGSGHADHLTGHDGDNSFEGRAGADKLDGGEGFDYVGYWSSDAGVTVNLATGTGQGGHAEGDTFTGIEGIHGSEHADHLTGDDGDNYLDGHAGADKLDGGEGADTFVFGDGDTVADFEDGNDLIDIYNFGYINADNFEAEVTIRQSGDDVEVQIGDAVLTLTGVSAADIAMEDFSLA